MRHLSEALQYLPKLITLELHHNQIGDDGIQ